MAHLPVPDAPLPLLALRSGVLFPGAQLTVTVGRPRSLASLAGLFPGDVLAVFGQRSSQTADPGRDDLVEIGTLAKVTSLTRKSAREVVVGLEGLVRVELASFSDEGAHLAGVVTERAERRGDDPEAVELARALVAMAKENGASPTELGELGGLGPAEVAARVTAELGLPGDLAGEVLAADDVPDRLRLVVKRFAEAKNQAEVRSKIEREVRGELGRAQKEAILREQMKAIRRELSSSTDGEDETERLRRRLDEANLPEEARTIADRELVRFESTNGQGPESNVIRTYLETLADLPWDKRAEAKDDVGSVAEALDRDHHGMEDVKKRILEHMAVLKLAGATKGTLLCLVGPPGVGKTSLATSIATATGRPFVRVSLGGVRDEAEIRGHRRTYVGALPGRLVAALRKAKVKNPVVLLDEIDKLGTGWGGSPEAALLEVLDPEQNKTFTDHYLETPFDLSEVLFVCTANTLETLSAPLRDRLEIVELTGYTPEEKLHIARTHVLPRRLAEHGLAEAKLTFDDAALDTLVREHTREAGVRQLDRLLTRIVRAFALEVAKAGPEAARTKHVTTGDLGELVGRSRFEREVRERTSIPGVATGLAWTPVGGSILFVETSRMPGKGRVEITGQLGDVMKESARAAFTYVRSHADALGIPSDTFDREDVHIHVPQGAVPKDGPSAGVTIFTALASLFSGRKVRSDTAMTGEATLRGRVLPVGGIKSKVLAAHAAGIRRVIVPKRCEKDLDEVPEQARKELEVFLVEDMTEVLEAALEPLETPLAVPFGLGAPAGDAGYAPAP